MMWPPDTLKKSFWTYKQRKKGESSAILLNVVKVCLFPCELVGLLKHLKGSLESEIYPTVPWPESAFIGPSHFCGSLDHVTNFRSGACEKEAKTLQPRVEGGSTVLQTTFQKLGSDLVEFNECVWKLF